MKIPLNCKIASALTIPNPGTRFQIELENRIVSLLKVRPDLSYKLIEEKIEENAKELRNTFPDFSIIGSIKTVSSVFYNRALAGEPMPWEVKK